MAFWDFGDLYANRPPQTLELSQATLSPQELTAFLPPQSRLQALELITLNDQFYYRVSRINDSTLLMDMQGQIHSPLSLEMAKTLGQVYYLGSAKLKSIDFLPESKGNYYASTPVYRLRFDDAQKTEIFIDPDSGSLLARRKALWRWYNRFWEFHLMKYTPSAKLNKILLLSFAVLAVWVSLSGVLKFFKGPYDFVSAGPATSSKTLLSKGK